MVAIALALVVATTDSPTSRASDGAEPLAPASSTPASDDAADAWPRPFDPDSPLDLSGVAGVTADEQAAAEALVGDVAASAHVFDTVEAAEAGGYRSIGDSFTGSEHFVNWSYVTDGRTLDAARPEALVFDVGDDGERTLVSVMFVEPPGTPLSRAPAVGGSLTPWHLHGDLCLDGDADPPRIGGITDAAGACPTGLEALQPAPTLHVWLVGHPCGPFAELEGVGTGELSDLIGACVHRHGR